MLANKEKQGTWEGSKENNPQWLDKGQREHMDLKLKCTRWVGDTLKRRIGQAKTKMKRAWFTYLMETQRGRQKKKGKQKNRGNRNEHKETTLEI